MGVQVTTSPWVEGSVVLQVFQDVLPPGFWCSEWREPFRAGARGTQTCAIWGPEFQRRPEQRCSNQFLGKYINLGTMWGFLPLLEEERSEQTLKRKKKKEKESLQLLPTGARESISVPCFSRWKVGLFQRCLSGLKSPPVPTKWSPGPAHGHQMVFCHPRRFYGAGGGTQSLVLARQVL